MCVRLVDREIGFTLIQFVFSKEENANQRNNKKKQKNKWKRAFHFSYEYVLVWHSYTTMHETQDFITVFLYRIYIPTYLWCMPAEQFSKQFRNKESIKPRTQHSTFVQIQRDFVRQAFQFKAINEIANEKYFECSSSFFSRYCF